MSVLERALYAHIDQHYRATRQPAQTTVLADYLQWDARQVRAILRRMADNGKVRKIGERGGWIPARGERMAAVMDDVQTEQRKPKVSNRARGKKRRRDIYEFICTYADEMDGPTPSINEISQHFRLNYKTTYYHILRLINEGKLRQEKGKLVVVGSEWLEPPRPTQLEFEF